MEDCNGENNSKKRGRDDSLLDLESSESKRSRVDSDAITSGMDPDESGLDTDPSKLKQCGEDSDVNRVDSEIPDMNSPETEKITGDILSILDDPDNDPEIQDLDSVIKSFEEEIQKPEPTTDSGELGYLLGASDDELGLPPAFSPSENQPENKEVPDLDPNPADNALEFGENFAFVDELPSYDSYEFGIGEDNGGNEDFVTLGGGLFDYSEAAEYSWRPESLPAL